jgi:hypothetical protein
MTIGSILLWGFMATLVLTGTLAASQGLGLSRMSLPFILGTVLTPDRARANVLGFAMHFVNGWAFAILYALVFQSLRVATWWLGAIGGLVHGLFVLLVLLPILPEVHPRMATERHGPTPTRMLQPPGFLALHYGRRTPLATILAHVAYGAILGAFYHLTGS